MTENPEHIQVGDKRIRLEELIDDYKRLLKKEVEEKELEDRAAKKLQEEVELKPYQAEL